MKKKVTTELLDQMASLSDLEEIDFISLMCMTIVRWAKANDKVPLDVTDIIASGIEGVAGDKRSPDNIASTVSIMLSNTSYSEFHACLATAVMSYAVTNNVEADKIVASILEVISRPEVKEMGRVILADDPIDYDIEDGEE